MTLGVWQSAQRVVHFIDFRCSMLHTAVIHIADLHDTRCIAVVSLIYSVFLGLSHYTQKLVEYCTIVHSRRRESHRKQMHVISLSLLE
jgi:hypothetical protein